MFKALDEAELNIVIDAMEEKKFEAPALTEESFVRMIRALIGVKEKLSGAGISIDS